MEANSLTLPLIPAGSIPVVIDEKGVEKSAKLPFRRVHTKKSNFFYFVAYFAIVTLCFHVGVMKNPMKKDYTSMWNTIFDFKAKDNQVTFLVFMFYAFLYVLGFVGILINTCGTKLLRKQVGIRALSSWKYYILTTLMVILNICWISFFWYTDFKGSTYYTWKKPYSYVHFTAKYLDLLWPLSFLFFCRTSIWERILHMPQIMTLAYHRIVGMIAISAVVVHLIAAYVAWYQSFLAKVPTDLSTWRRVWSAVGSVAHKNFNYSTGTSDFQKSTKYLLRSVPAMILAFTVCLSFFRRKVWELFYVSHVLYQVFFTIVCLWHSRNMFRELSIGLVFYAIDILYRIFTRYIATSKIVSMKPIGGYVRVDVLRKNCSKSFEPGSYVFLCIPTVGFGEYHPLTIGYFEDGHFIFYVKDQGPRTWSHQLSVYAEKVTKGQAKLPIVFMEGPFSSSYSTNPNTVNAVFIGAGIGIAGISASLVDMIRRFKAGKLTKLERIDAVFIVRNLQQFDTFAEIFTECVDEKICNLMLYCTFSDQPSSAPLNKARNANTHALTGTFTTIRYTAGRPNVVDLVNEFPATPAEAFICAPGQLEADVFKQMKKLKRDYTLFCDPFDM